MKNKTAHARDSTDQWNIPDWEKVHLYPKAKELSLDGWRWEFLRRDPEYRADWLRYRTLNHPFQLSLKGDPETELFELPYYPEEFADRWDDIWRILRKYGLARLLDPSISRPKYLQFHFVPFRSDLTDIPELRDSGITSLPWKLSNPYLAWFELWSPIEPQLAFISDLLKREQRVALQTLKKSLPGGVGRRNKTLENWEPPEMEVVLTPKGKKQSTKRQDMSSLYPSAMRNRPPDRTGCPDLLRVWDARSAGVTFQQIGVKVLGSKPDDYSTAISNAQATLKAAKGMWRKIRAERIPGPVIGQEEIRFEHTWNVIPPFREDSSRLDDWLNYLHPRLHTLLLSSLR